MNQAPRVAQRLGLGAAALLACAALLWSQSPPGDRCTVTLRLVDSLTDAPFAGLIRITDDEGQRVELPELVNRGQGIDGTLPIHEWSVVPAEQPVSLALPRRRLILTALSGLETEAARLTLDLRGRDEHAARVPLTRFSRLADAGLRSANTHLHLIKLSRAQADRYLSLVPAADGLDLLFVSYLERAGADHEYTTNRYTRAELAALGGQSGVPLAHGEEHRHNFAAQGEGFGHVLLLDLPQLVRPVSIGPGIMRAGTDGLPIQRGIDTARGQGAAAIWCHNHWGLEFVPNWVLGRLDAQNIFDGGEHGSYRDSFYRLLNAGFKVPFSTGTDWFLYDFARVYAPVEGELSPRAWLRSLAAGRSFITNGPLLRLEVAGRGPGETLRLPAPRKVIVKARGAGRGDFRRIELVRNGAVLHSAPSRAVAGHFEAEARWELDLATSGWLALRTPPPPASGNQPAPTVEPEPPNATPFPVNELGRPLFSHTSPVYIELAGRPMDNTEAVKDLLRTLEQSREQVLSQATFADATERATVLAVYDEALDHLRRRSSSRESGKPAGGTLRR